MSTTQRVVRKQLAGAEDILQGVGTVTQTRGSGSYPIHKLDIPIPTYDIAEMQASSAEFMRLYGTDTAYTDYRRNPEGTIGIPSNLGGVWEPMRSSEYLVCGNFATGAYVFSPDCIVTLDQQSYNWQGATPKVVPAGSTPATSGGIGAVAWVDRTDVTFRDELTVTNQTGATMSLSDPNTAIWNITNGTGGTGALTLEFMSYLRVGQIVKVISTNSSHGWNLVVPSGLTIIGAQKAGSLFGAYVTSGLVDILTITKISDTQFLSEYTSGA